MVNAFWQWYESECQRHDLLPSNSSSKALKNAMARLARLKIFLSDPDVPPLFCWSGLGARQIGIIQSLLVTGKLQGINPYTYLVDVLQRVRQHPASKAIDLTPRLWKETFADNVLKCYLERVGQ